MAPLVRVEHLQLGADLRLEVSAYPGALELRLLRRTPADTFGPTAAGFRLPVLFVPRLAEVLRELAVEAVASPDEGGHP